MRLLVLPLALSVLLLPTAIAPPVYSPDPDDPVPHVCGDGVRWEECSTIVVRLPCHDSDDERLRFACPATCPSGSADDLVATAASCLP